jgi:photosystem II stability/assembly factor-like uncharacterized protein
MLLAVAAPAALAGGGWVTQVDYPPAFTTIWAISCPSATHCVLVGDEADLVAAVAIGSGSSWTRGTLPAGVSQLFAVSCPSVKVCVAGGNTFSRETGSSPVIIYSANGGATWAIAAVPAGLGGQSTVSCSSASDCLAGGGGTTLYVTSDGGKKWSAQAGPAGATQVFQLSCPAGSSTCVGVGANGTEQPQILVYSNKKWKATLYPAAEAALKSVDCTSSSDCVIVGGSSPALILTTTNGGTTWKPDKVPSGISQLSGVSCVSASACVGVGQGIGVAGAVTGSISTGTFVAAVPPAGYGDLTGVSCVSGSAACTSLGVVGTSVAPAVATSTDSGAKWTAESLPPAPFPLSSVSCGAAAHCVAVGTGPTGGVVESTSNGGALWTTHVITAITSLSSVTCSSATDCEAVGTGKFGGQFLVTTNGGSTWTMSILTGPTTMDQPLVISCPTTSHCVVLGAITPAVPPDLTTFSTIDGGKNWTGTGTSLVDDALNGLSCSSVSDCVMVGNGGTEGGAYILRTTTFGTNWTSEPVPTSPTLFMSLASVSCASTSDCVVVGAAQQNDVLTTSNGGTSWKEKPYSPSVNDSLYDVSCRSTADCVMVGIDNLGLEPGAIETSTNGGASWVTAAAPSTSFKLLSVACWSATACVAVGEDSTQHGSIIISSVAPVPPLKITTASLASGTVGKAYKATMKASGGTAPYTWKVSVGKPPSGLALSAAGVWSGKPKKAGKYSFTLQVTDKTGKKLAKAFTIVIAK